MTNSQISPKTVCVVSAAHAVFLLLVVLLARHQPAPPPPLTMLDLSLGLPENLNPAKGDPSAQPRAPAPKNQTPPSPPAPVAPPPPAPVPPPVAPPTSPPAPVVPPEPSTPPPVKPSLPAAPVTPKPPPSRPRVPVKPVLDNPVIRTTASKPADAQRPSGSGNPRDAGRSLSNSGGNLNAGVSGGSLSGTDGSPGAPDGNPSGDWYRTLIKNTLERHWMKPQSGNPNLAATVKIRILADGAIQSLGMVSGSGNAEMDTSVLDAVRAAGKISTPPPKGFPVPYEDTVIFRLKSDL